MKSIIPTIKRIAQIAASLISVFISPMPVPNELAFWAGILAAVTVLVSWIAVMRFTGRRTLSIISIGSLVASVVCGVLFWASLPTRTYAHHGYMYITGDELTEMAREKIAVGKVADEFEFFRWVGDDPEKVWTKRSIQRSRFTLAVLYSLFVAPLTFGAIVGIHLLPEYRSRNRQR